MGKDSEKKSLTKAITWRIISIILTVGISYFVTGSKIFALEIGVLDAIIKTISYYFHERLWNKI